MSPALETDFTQEDTKENENNSFVKFIKRVFGIKTQTTIKKNPKKSQKKEELNKEQKREIELKKRESLVAFVRLNKIIADWKVVLAKEESEKPLPDKNIKQLLLKAVENLNFIIIKFNQIETRFNTELGDEKRLLGEIMSVYHALFEHYKRSDTISQIKKTKKELEDIEELHDLQKGIDISKKRKKFAA
ncbi:MAG: hypothetical protein ISS01_01740 [Nanoarchaeota archaeon]|nr:hypothetical protein [Nanoarchaeota archaeon]